MNWYNNFYIENSKLNINEKYIEKLNTKVQDKNIESKVNKIEEEYQENLKKLTELCSNNNTIELFKNSNSLVIIQKELEIIKILTKYMLQNNDLSYDFFISCLNILYELSEILRKD
jgi:hypothetical protein